MRKFSLVILIAIAGSLAAMILIHRQSIDHTRQKQVKIELLQQRQGALRDMSVSLEKYRRLSANFRKVTETEMDLAKGQLRKSMKAGLAKLEQSEPNPEEAGFKEKIEHGLDEMISFAEKFERVAYNKDAYQKAEMVAFHEGVESALKQLGESTENRISSLANNTGESRDHAMPLLIGLAGLILLFWLLHSIRSYLAEERPLRKLSRFSDELSSGKVDLTQVKRLRGVYGDIQSALTNFFQAVQGHSRERHKFILDVVSDLRSPLMMVSSGKHLLGRAGESIDPTEELKSIDSVKRGLAMLSGSLEDFDDLVEYSRLDSRLDENLVDLSELVADVARTLNAGPGLEKQISTSVPPMPIWVRVDARRFERVLMQAISKVAATLQRGTGIHVSVQQPTQGSFRGVEILVQDLERSRGETGKNIGSGPSIDVLKHWISEKGLGMTLAHRVIKAQGGSLTASGVSGTTVQLAIRLPQERLAQVGLISAPRGLEVNFSRKFDQMMEEEQSEQLEH